MAAYAWRIHAALLAVQVLFGSWPVVGKIVLRSIPGPMLIGMRATAATALFFALGQRARLTRRQHALTAVAALLGITVNQLLFIGGLARTGAVNSTVLATTIPVWTLLFSLLTRTESSSPQKLLGMATAFVGALVVTGAGRLRLGNDFLVGNLMLLCSTACYAAYLILGRRLSQELQAMALVPWIFFYGAVFTLPFALPYVVDTQVAWDPTLIAMCIYIVLGPTVGAYFLNAVALREAPPSLVAVYIYVQPLVAAMFAIPFLDEKLTPEILLGSGIIFVGVFISTRQK